MPKKASIFGSYSGHNKGDLAILFVLLKHLLKSSKGLNLLIPSKRPAKLKKVLPKFTEHEMVIYKTFTAYWGIGTLKSIASSDVLVFGGGGLFFDKKFYDPFSNHVINLFLITLVNNFFFKKPIYIFSVGASHLRSKMMLLMTSYILKSASRVTVRDHLTAKLFSKHYKREIKIFYDPAFLLESNIGKTPRIEQFCHQLSAEKKALFVFNSSFLIRIKKESKTGELVELINYLQKRYEVVLSSTTTECRLVDTLASLCEQKSLMVFHPGDINPEELITFFQCFDFVICVPMHAAIFSYNAGIRMITIEYDDKIKAFNRIIGNENSVKIDELKKIPLYIELYQEIEWNKKKIIRQNALTNILKLEEFIYDN